MSRKTTIINLIGGPGVGKSTSAAYMYYQLKAANKSVELVREFVKSYAYEKKVPTVYDQIYFLGQQTHREASLYGKVDYIVTDSPVILCPFYAHKTQSPYVSHGVLTCAQSFYHEAVRDGHNHYFVLLDRATEYQPEGRYETKEQAEIIDSELRFFMQFNKIKYSTCGTDNDSINSFLTGIGVK